MGSLPPWANVRALATTLWAASAEAGPAPTRDEGAEAGSSVVLSSSQPGWRKKKKQLFHGVVVVVVKSIITVLEGLNVYFLNKQICWTISSPPPVLFSLLFLTKWPIFKLRPTGLQHCLYCAFQTIPLSSGDLNRHLADKCIL